MEKREQKPESKKEQKPLKKRKRKPIGKKIIEQAKEKCEYIAGFVPVTKEMLRDMSSYEL